MYNEIRIAHAGQLGTRLCSLCVCPVLAVVRQISNLVLPFTCLLVVDIRDEFVYRSLCFLYARHRQTTYTYIHPSAGITCALTVVQEAEIVIRGIGVYLVGGVLRLVGQQQCRAGCRQELAVIKRTMTEQQQPSRLLADAVVSTVVEHLH